MEITEGQVLNFWLQLVGADPTVKFVRDAQCKWEAVLGKKMGSGLLTDFLKTKTALHL
jgi:hypothetical protein